MSPLDHSIRLQTLRGERGWSQEELAQASGVSARTIQRLESGTPPSRETARAIAAAFDLEPREIFSAKAEGQPAEGGSLQGVRWGISGALLGYASAFVAVTYSLLAGHTSGWHAGLTLGALGAATGVFCGGIAWHSRRAEGSN